MWKNEEIRKIYSFFFSPVSEVYDQFIKDLRVHVLADLHQQEPVSKPEFLHDHGHVLSPRWLGSTTEHEVARLSGEEKN